MGDDYFNAGQAEVWKVSNPAEESGFDGEATRERDSTAPGGMFRAELFLL